MDSSKVIAIAALAASFYFKNENVVWPLIPASLYAIIVFFPTSVNIPYNIVAGVRG